MVVWGLKKQKPVISDHRLANYWNKRNFNHSLCRFFCPLQCTHQWYIKQQEKPKIHAFRQWFFCIFGFFFCICESMPRIQLVGQMFLSMGSRKSLMTVPHFIKMGSAPPLRGMFILIVKFSMKLPPYIHFHMKMRSTWLAAAFTVILCLIELGFLSFLKDSPIQLLAQGNMWGHNIG